jgi:hypothetical protein
MSSPISFLLSLAAIYTSIDINEVGEDTRRLLGIPAGGDMGSAGSSLHAPPHAHRRTRTAAHAPPHTHQLAPLSPRFRFSERKALLKISHRGKLRASGQHRKESSGKRSRGKKSSQDGLVKQMDYGEIVLAERVGKGSYGEVRFLSITPLHQPLIS